MQYPFPYKTSDGEIQDTDASGNGPLVVTNTDPATGFTNDTGALQVHGGTQIKGSLWVGGNIYLAGRIYQTTFNPTITTSSGTLGTVVYTSQSGNIQLSANSSVAICTLLLTFTYTGAASGPLFVSGLPDAGISTRTVIPDIVMTPPLTSPVHGIMVASGTDIELRNANTLASVTLTGSGNLSILISAYYLTGAITAIPFTPVLGASGGSLGVVVYSSQVGRSNTFGSARCYVVVVTGSTSGGVSPTGLRLQSLPAASVLLLASGGVDSDMSGTTLFSKPIALRASSSDTNLSLLNVSTGLVATGLNEGTFNISSSGIYFTGSGTSFTPTLYSYEGSLGSIVYTSQIGRYTSVGKGYVYFMKMDGSYTGASSQKFGAASLPFACGIVPACTKQIISTLEEPLVYCIDVLRTTGYFYNDSTLTNTTLTGSGTFEIRITGVYLGL